MTRKYRWVIDVDYFSDDKSDAAGISGPSNHLPLDITDNEKTFLLVDDDNGEPYYKGRIFGQYNGFEPLDDFGKGAAGATEVHYWNEDRGWKRL